MPRLVGLPSTRVMDETTGGVNTTRFAVLLAVPAMFVSVVVTPEVAFGFVPSVLLLTEKVTVQMPPLVPEPGIMMLVKLRVVSLGLRMLGEVPLQLPPTEPPTVLILASVSLNEALFNAATFGLVSVRVTNELPPVSIVPGLNPFAIVGRPKTVRLTGVLPAPSGVWSVVTPVVKFG